MTQMLTVLKDGKPITFTRINMIQTKYLEQKLLFCVLFIVKLNHVILTLNAPDFLFYKLQRGFTEFLKTAHAVTS